MHRTTIMLPDELKSLAEAQAQRMGCSLGQLIRDALDRELRQSPEDGARDSLFGDLETFDKPGPKDVSVNHDEYLYGGTEL